MAIEIKAPTFPESVEIETDKVVMEVVAPEDGVISAIHVQEGDTIESEQLLATLEQGAAADAPAAVAEVEAAPVPATAAEADLPALLGPAARQLVEELSAQVQDLQERLTRLEASVTDRTTVDRARLRLRRRRSIEGLR